MTEIPVPIAPQSVINAVFANNTQVDMRTIVWAKNAAGVYDIQNKFTASGNAGNLEVIRSKILIILSTFQKEWAPQEDFGLPLETMAIYSSDPSIVASLVQDQILTVENVNSVSTTNFEASASPRTFEATFAVNTIYGVLEVTA
jgi:hypothetical protein